MVIVGYLWGGGGGAGGRGGGQGGGGGGRKSCKFGHLRILPILPPPTARMVSFGGCQGR